MSATSAPAGSIAATYRPEHSFNNITSPSVKYVAVLGPPGAGKGTLCKRLVERYPLFVKGHQQAEIAYMSGNSPSASAADYWATDPSKRVRVYHIGMGDILREYVAKEKAIAMGESAPPADEDGVDKELRRIFPWHVVQANLDQGALADPNVAVKLLDQRKRRLEKEGNWNAPDAGTVFVLLDGFPRSRDRAEVFQHEIAPVDMVIQLSCSLEVVMKRLLHRRREDDTEEAIRKRFELSEFEGKKVLDYFTEKLAQVNRISAEQGEDAVQQHAMQLLSSLLDDRCMLEDD